MTILIYGNLRSVNSYLWDLSRRDRSTNCVERSVRLIRGEWCTKCLERSERLRISAGRPIASSDAKGSEGKTGLSTASSEARRQVKEIVPPMAASEARGLKGRPVHRLPRAKRETKNKIPHFDYMKFSLWDLNNLASYLLPISFIR